MSVSRDGDKTAGRCEYCEHEIKRKNVHKVCTSQYHPGKFVHTGCCGPCAPCWGRYRGIMKSQDGGIADYKYPIIFFWAPCCWPSLACCLGDLCFKPQKKLEYQCCRADDLYSPGCAPRSHYVKGFSQPTVPGSPPREQIDPEPQTPMARDGSFDRLPGSPKTPSPAEEQEMKEREQDRDRAVRGRKDSDSRRRDSDSKPSKASKAEAEAVAVAVVAPEPELQKAAAPEASAEAEVAAEQPTN